MEKGESWGGDPLNTTSGWILLGCSTEAHRQGDQAQQSNGRLGEWSHSLEGQPRVQAWLHLRPTPSGPHSLLANELACSPDLLGHVAEPVLGRKVLQAYLPIETCGAS